MLSVSLGFLQAQSETDKPKAKLDNWIKLFEIFWASKEMEAYTPHLGLLTHSQCLLKIIQYDREDTHKKVGQKKLSMSVSGYSKTKKKQKTKKVAKTTKTLWGGGVTFVFRPLKTNFFLCVFP